jgi:hypothetical protein
MVAVIIEAITVGWTVIRWRLARRRRRALG